MQCPSCGKNQPMSFKCRHCGAQLVKRPGRVARSTAGPSPRPQPQAAAAAVALDNLYQAPDVAAQAPIRVSYGEKALASRGSRLAAQFVDGLLVLTMFIPFFAAVATGAESAAGGAMLVGFLIFFVLAGLQIFYLSRDGQTIGKKVKKIRIVRYDDGGNPGFVKTVLLRLIVNVFLGIIPGYVFVDPLFIFGTEQRCIHDLLAGTKVVEA